MNEKNHLTIALSYSYITLIDEYLSVLNNTLYSSIEYLDEDLCHISKETATLFLALPEILKDSDWPKEECIHKVLSYKTRLENKYRLLSSYQRELEHLFSFHHFYGSEIENSTMDETTNGDSYMIDFDHLISDCTEFIFNSNNIRDRQERASLLLPYIPTKMTIESFIEYTRKSLYHIHIQDEPDSAALLISILKQLFKGSLYENYGKELEDIFISIEELKDTKDPDTFLDNAELLTETLENLMSVTKHLYKALCAFANLLILDSITIENVTDTHISFHDLYFNLKTIIKDQEDKQLLLESLPERTDSIRKDIFKHYMKECKTKKDDPLFTLMQAYLNVDLSNVFMFDIGRVRDYSSIVSEQLDSFLQELRKELSSADVPERRLRMQYFMSVIPFIMSKTTFSSYLSKSIGKIHSLDKRIFIGSHLADLLEEAGYFDTEKQE